MKIGRNEKCPCGSGKKYKKCCLLKDEAIKRAIPMLKQQMEEGRLKTVALEARGIYENYVKPIDFNGRRVFALGKIVYYDRPPLWRCTTY